MRWTPALFLAATLACTPSATEAESPPEPQPTTAKAESAEDSETTASKAAEVGQPAPGFTLKDLDGETYSLADLKGKTVVLEWFNPGCPYVVGAYEGGPLATMVAEAQEKGVVWLAINSGAPGKQGHGVEVNREARSSWSMPHPILLDEDGAVGRSYGAKVTPHMYVINPEGVLTYAGALDNAPRNKVPESGHIAFTHDAITATLAGEPVRASKTQAWGCTVKYGS